MEDKKTIKISLSTVICLIIIFILLVALVGVLFYFNFSNKNNSNLNEFTLSNQISNTVKNESLENKTNTIKEPDISSNEITQQNNIISTIEENSSKLKIDETKELVYDANYTYENLAGKSYKYENALFEQVCSFDDIIVPYINIDSEDANKANKEIKNIFEECAEYFKKNIEVDNPYGFSNSNYKYYVNDDIVSIIITTFQYDDETFQRETKNYTYNFDLSTKKMLDYEGVYKKVGFSADNINDKVKKAINDRYTNDRILGNENLSLYQNESFQNYNKSVVNNTIKFFLDASKKLNIIVTMKYYAAQFDSGNETLTIE